MTYREVLGLPGGTPLVSLSLLARVPAAITLTLRLVRTLDLGQAAAGARRRARHRPWWRRCSPAPADDVARAPDRRTGRILCAGPEPVRTSCSGRTQVASTVCLPCHGSSSQRPSGYPAATVSAIS